MTAQTGSDEFGDFLQARRAQLSPESVGISVGSTRRKVSGLRRSEVAMLAAISVEYYTRLEQGRVRASSAVLATLARALRLDETQERYMYELAGRTDARLRRRPAQRLRPPMRRLLDQLTDAPAMVLGRRLDVLAWNSSAVALFVDFAQLPPARRNYIWLLFADPAFRAMHRNWEHDARDAVGALRLGAGADAGDPALAQLVGELSLKDPDFGTWWAEHRVSGSSYGTKHYRHPLVGELTLDCDTWSDPDGSGQRLIVLTAEPGSPSHDALRVLASWTADAHAESMSSAEGQRR